MQSLGHGALMSHLTAGSSLIDCARRFAFDVGGENSAAAGESLVMPFGSMRHESDPSSPIAIVR